jgi:hypothetical protein
MYNTVPKSFWLEFEGERGFEAVVESGDCLCLGQSWKLIVKEAIASKARGSANGCFLFKRHVSISFPCQVRSLVYRLGNN